MTVRDLKSTWENLGRTDPLWAVLSDPARRHGKWGLDEFMATGEEQVGLITSALARHDLSLGERVLDFGCGVGRLSNALAGHAPRVVGVDIAASMVARAQELNRHPGRLDFVAYDGRLLPFPDDSFDSAVSLIVLQHARPAVQLGALLELLRVVRPGGLLLVQIPSEPKRVETMPPEAFRSRIELLDVPAELVVNTSATVRARVHNVSEHTWPTDRLIKLANTWLREDVALIGDDARCGLPQPVPADTSIELDLLVTAPSSPGPAVLELDVMQEFVTWFGDWGSPTARAEVLVTAAPAEPAPVEPAATEPGTTAPAAENSAAESEDLDPGGTMEMHGLHTDLVRSVFAHCGAEVVEAAPDALAGAEWESFTYLIRLES